MFKIKAAVMYTCTYCDLAVKSYVFIPLLKYFLQSIQSIFDMLLMEQPVSLMLFEMFNQLLKLKFIA